MSTRFRINEKSRTATLAGVDYQDLRSIFDGAAIHYHDDLRKLRAKKRLTAHEKESKAWVEHQLKVLETIKQAVDAGIQATFPKRLERPLTKKERWALIDHAKKERELFDRIFSAMMVEARAAHTS